MNVDLQTWLEIEEERPLVFYAYARTHCRTKPKRLWRDGGKDGRRIVWAIGGMGVTGEIVPHCWSMLNSWCVFHMVLDNDANSQ